MSLQIWLPLNGDINNFGLDSAKPSGNIVYDANGKIGKCGRMDSQLSLVPTSQIYTDNMSVSFWIRSTASSPSWHTIIALDNINLSGIHAIYIAEKDRIKYEYNPSINIYSTISEWHHYTFVLSNGKSYGYLDGKLKTTSTEAMTHDLIGRIRIGAAKNSMFLNDVRIYDHCLSAKEVGELAKGLVLHYRLAGPGGENLLSQYVTCGGNHPGDTSGGGRMQYAGDYKIIIPVTEDRDTYFSLWTTTPLVQGQQYTISCYVEGLLPTSYYQFPLFEQGNGSMGNFKLDHNGLCQLTFTMNYTKSITTANVGGKTYYQIFMDDNSRYLASGQLNSSITLTNFKLEEGSIATPWCPESGSNLYTALGYNNNIEYDCSGYRHNGTKSGTITWDIDSPRYTTSYKFYYGKIISTYSPIGLTNATMTAWVNPSSYDSERSCIMIGGIYLTIEASGKLSGYAYGKNPAGYHDGKATIPLNKWTHIALVWNDTHLIGYVNGVEDFKIACTGTFNSDACIEVAIEKSWRAFLGKLSDTRIYATALSAEDIAELYHSAVIVDNTGKSYAYEYFEA